MEPDFVDLSFPQKYIIFKPKSVQRLFLTKIGDPIDCNNTDCIDCIYEQCDIKQRTIERNKWLGEQNAKTI